MVRAPVAQNGQETVEQSYASCPVSPYLGLPAAMLRVWKMKAILLAYQFQ